MWAFSAREKQMQSNYHEGSGISEVPASLGHKYTPTVSALRCVCVCVCMTGRESKVALDLKLHNYRKGSKIALTFF